MSIGRPSLLPRNNKNISLFGDYFSQQIADLIIRNDNL